MLIDCLNLWILLDDNLFKQKRAGVIMSIVKSFSVGNGDTFYIKHGSDNFSIIDCCLTEENEEEIVDEILEESKSKGITRFISTHPDEDHFKGLYYLNKQKKILNFYCVKNKATKEEETDDFKKYKELRDDKEKAFYLSKNCKRKWMNQSGEDDDGNERGQSGLSIIWPDTNDQYFKDELKKAEEGTSFNNISIILQYNAGPKFLWMGDLETEMMENIEDDLSISKSNILFASHHGRKSGKIPKSILEKIDPDLVVVGEAPAKDLEYYQNYKTITQNSSGDITFHVENNNVHIYVFSDSYSVDFLADKKKSKFSNYIGTLDCS